MYKCVCVCSWFTETTQSIFLSAGLKLLNTVRGKKQMYVEGGGNLRLLPTSQVHRQSLWRDKDHESISIRVRLGVAHRQVRRTRESLFPLRMAQGFLMEIWPLQKLNRCYLEDIMWSVLLFNGRGRQKRQTQAAAQSAFHEQTAELSSPWRRWWWMQRKHCTVTTGGAFPFPLPLPR